MGMEQHGKPCQGRWSALLVPARANGAVCRGQQCNCAEAWRWNAQEESFAEGGQQAPFMHVELAPT